MNSAQICKLTSCDVSQVVNYSHLFPTRYALELESLKGSVAAETFKEPSQRVDARKNIKKLLEERYQSGKNKWFFQPLRVSPFMISSMFKAYYWPHSSDRYFLYLWYWGGDIAKLHVHHMSLHDLCFLFQISHYHAQLPLNVANWLADQYPVVMDENEPERSASGPLHRRLSIQDYHRALGF